MEDRKDHTSTEYTREDQAASEPDFYGKWIDIEVTQPRPDTACWFITASKDTLNVVPRYWDGEAWWIYSNHHDNYTLVPNNFLAYWMPMPHKPTH